MDYFLYNMYKNGFIIFILYAIIIQHSGYLRRKLMSSNVNSKRTGNTRYKKKKKKRFRLLKIFLLCFLCVFILAGIAASGFVFATIKSAPDLDINGTILNLDQPSQLYDDAGNSMDTVITSQKRYVVSINDVPQNLSNAFVSIEDERFYKHKGIDTKRILGAFYNDIKAKLHKQNNIQGASTITQQLIKTRLFLNDSLQNRLSLKRKVQEAYLAMQLEKYLSKKQILEAYMNTIFLGGQANGVEAAARQYFGKDVKDLNLIQCAFIAGLAQSPSSYYPFSPNAQKNPNVYLNRTRQVLLKMQENGYISSADYQSAMNDLNANKLTASFSTYKVSNKYNYEWFSIPVVDQVKKDLKSEYHYTDEEIDSLLRDGDLKIYTTMNTDLQNKVQDTLNNTYYLKKVSFNNKNSIVQPEASAVVYDYHTGEVKAMVGGRGDQPPTSYNRAYSSSYLRATGSSIKPLTVYAPAIDTKLATTETIVDDSPLSDELQQKYSSNGKPYNPNNDDFQFHGPTTIRNAITNSVNLVAIKVEDQLGLDVGASYAQKFGINLNNSDKTSIAALSLGEFSGTNTYTMAAAYGVFGNGGLYSTPRLYTKVVDKTGKVILQSKYSTRKVISPQAAYIMYDMLKGPINSGTATEARSELGDMPAGGKTGSSTDFRDLWFCGLTPYYSAAVWVGNDDNTIPNVSSNDVSGIWGQIMNIATKNQPIKDINMPDGVVTIGNDIYIDGTAPTNLTPNDASTDAGTGASTPTNQTPGQNQIQNTPVLQGPGNNNQVTPGSATTPSNGNSNLPTNGGGTGNTNNPVPGNKGNSNGNGDSKNNTGKH